jgi:hypothetical protein
VTACSKLLIQSAIDRAESHNKLIAIIGSSRGPDQLHSVKLRVRELCRQGHELFCSDIARKKAQPNNNRSKLIGIGGGFKDKGSVCLRLNNIVRKRSNTANWARQRPVQMKGIPL